MIENDNCDICGHVGPVSVMDMKTYFGEAPMVRICPKCAAEVVMEHESVTPPIEQPYDKEVVAEAQKDLNNG